MFIVLSKVYHINVSPVHTLNTPLSRVQSDGSSSVYSCYCYSVSRVHCVYQVVVRVQDHCVRRLARRHVV